MRIIISDIPRHEVARNCEGNAMYHVMDCWEWSAGFRTRVESASLPVEACLFKRERILLSPSPHTSLAYLQAGTSLMIVQSICLALACFDLCRTSRA